MSCALWRKMACTRRLYNVACCISLLLASSLCTLSLAAKTEGKLELMTQTEAQANMQVSTQVEAHTGVSKVRAYCEICILVMQMKQRGQPHLCAGLNANYYTTVTSVTSLLCVHCHFHQYRMLCCSVLRFWSRCCALIRYYFHHNTCAPFSFHRTLTLALFLGPRLLAEERVHAHG